MNTHFSATIPLSLYIHLPWCVKKCPYCDFNSHALRGALPEKEYVAALLADFNAQLPTFSDRKLISIFLGGGTPSLFSPKAIATLLNEIDHQIGLSKDIEITLEANPGTIDEKHFAGFYQAGINRLSIGIQSLQNQKLQRLGRIHDRDNALQAIQIAKKAGFKNFNLDLMHGLPDQTVDDALADLRDALATEPTHLSWYQLTLEPNTLFYAAPPTLPNEDILHAIQEAGHAELVHQGFKNYEISAWAQPDKHSRHNRNYWEFGDYCAIGAGAHGKLTDIKNKNITRYMQHKHPQAYLMGINNGFTATTSLIPDAELPFEFMLNALRLTDGVPLIYFTERTGLALQTIQNTLQIAYEKKLLKKDKTVLCPTPLGHRFLNQLTTLFIK